MMDETNDDSVVDASAVGSLAAFLQGIAGDGHLSLTAMEVPIDVFIEAAENSVLLNLEIARDEDGLPFLMGMVRSDGHQVIMVSESFAPSSPFSDEDIDEDIDEEVASIDPRLN